MKKKIDPLQFNSIVDEYFEALKTMNTLKTKPLNTQAEVVRVEGDTVWVHIPGGEPETPMVKNTDCKAGDIVQIQTNKAGRGWLVGNITSPPTDDTKAKKADMNAGKAMAKAKKAEAIAEEGLKEAQSTSNYFWYVDGSGTESGAHVTEMPQKDFLENPSGGNLLMQSASVKIRNALTNLASFTGDGLTIYNSYGEQLARFGKYITMGIGYVNRFEIHQDANLVSISQLRRNSAGEVTANINSITMSSDGTIGIFDTHSLPHVGLTIDGTKKYIWGSVYNVPISSSDFTVTTGSISSVEAKRFGQVVQLTMQVTKTSATNAGSNCFVGKLKLEDYRPAMTIQCASYSGSVAVIGSIETDGSIIARVTGAQLPADRSPILTFTYIILN